MVIIENRSYFDTLDDEVGHAVRKIDPKAKQSVYRESKAELFKLVRRRNGAFLVSGYFGNGLTPSVSGLIAKWSGVGMVWLWLTSNSPSTTELARYS